MKVLKEETNNQVVLQLPTRLQELIQNNVNQMQVLQANVDNLITGFLADKTIPEGYGVELSQDRTQIILKEL